MSKFSEAILTALGMAAKDAQSEDELNSLVTTAATALDAEPAEKAPGGGTRGDQARRGRNDREGTQG